MAQERHFWALSTHAFYIDQIHGSGVPQDAIEITLEQKQALIDAQSGGKTINVVNGAVVAIDKPGLTNDELLFELRAKRDRLLAACDWTVGSDTPLSSDKVASWKAYRQALRDLPAAPNLNLQNPAWPAPPG